MLPVTHTQHLCRRCLCECIAEIMRMQRRDVAELSHRYRGAWVSVVVVTHRSGWKQVHGDVFRPPAQLALFCALIGSGAQLVAMVAIMIVFAIATSLYMGRGGIIISFVFAPRGSNPGSAAWLPSRPCVLSAPAAVRTSVCGFVNVGSSSYTASRRSWPGTRQAGSTPAITVARGSRRCCTRPPSSRAPWAPSRSCSISSASPTAHSRPSPSRRSSSSS